jgi:hypothetical protein
MKHIVIGVPAYTGTIHLSTVRPLFHDMAALIMRGDKVTLIDDIGDTYIDDVRAAIVDRFLSSPADVLVTVDHDVCWEAHALVRLVDHPVDLVAGVYPKRVDPIEYPVRYILEREELISNPKTGLLEVAGVPAGFTKMSRAMLERMVGHYKDLQFNTNRSPRGKLCGLFEDYRLANGSKLKDDYAFCQRWRDIGGQVWCDPEIKMSHTGNKAFVGHFGDWLRSRPQEEKAA